IHRAVVPGRIRAIQLEGTSGIPLEIRIAPDARRVARTADAIARGFRHDAIGVDSRSAGTPHAAVGLGQSAGSARKRAGQRWRPRVDRDQPTRPAVGIGPKWDVEKSPIWTEVESPA